MKAHLEVIFIFNLTLATQNGVLKLIVLKSKHITNINFNKAYNTVLEPNYEMHISKLCRIEIPAFDQEEIISILFQLTFTSSSVATIQLI